MLGENIKTYRQKKGYTQEEVCQQTPCDKTDCFGMENELSRFQMLKCL